jgi:putative ABC transport system permease protein
VSGVVHDINQWPTPFLHTYYGYVTRDTLVALGEPYTFNELLIRVKGEGAGTGAGGVVTKAHAEEVAEQVYEKVQKSGRDPSFPRVATPGQHPLHFLITAIITIMGIMGVFSLFLSGFLVTNTISALLAQQIRQIGMMKAVGARTTQIMTIYFALVLCFGLLALAPAIPLARFASLSFAGFLATFLNFDLANASIPVYVVAVQATISLVIPMVAALVPIRSGTRMTIREALANEGVATSYGTGFLDRVIQRVRGLPRPLLLSLRNTFRRKGRVFLTLVTLTLGGAFFISVFGVRSALQLTINELVEALYNYDVDIYLDRTYRANHVEDEAMAVPGVVAAECSAMARVRRVLPDNRESLIISLYAVPPETRTMNPQIVAGRWLLPEDENALVLSTGVLKEDPDIQVGDDMLLKLEDRETTWRVVGLMKAMGEVRWAYASFDYYTRIAHQPGQSSYLRVVTRHHTGEFQAQVATALEEHFKQANIDVNSTKTIMELSQGDKEVIEVVTVSLMFMAILVAAVGALGLAGTMSLNVIERVREIGIMRSIGASDVTVLQIFMVEGIVIGMISWILGASLAVPLGQALSTTMGQMLFSSPLTFDIPVDGMVVWLVLSLVLAAVASFFPAWRATRVTVRDVLSYE